MEKIKIDEVIVVEGKDDTAAILKAVDAVTIETHGFGMSENMWELIDSAYEKKGIIIFTDPDRAGENIRRKILSKYPDARQAFLDRDKARKKDNIGIENAAPEDIVEALKKAKCSTSDETEVFTREDLIRNRLTGFPESAELRKKVGDVLGIGYANGKTFLKRLNRFGITREDFEKCLKEIR